MIIIICPPDDGLLTFHCINSMEAITHPDKKNFFRFHHYLILYFGVKVAFILSGPDLFTEEAQYWLWAQRPDWSYYSKPPLIAWVNYGMGIIFPHSDYVIRMTALMFGAGTLFIAYRLARLLFNNVRIAIMAVIILSVSPYFVIASTFFTTDSLLIFFWVASLYFLFRAQKDPSFINWSFTGLSFGLGCLSKYAMFFFLFALIPLLLTKEKRQENRGIVISLIIGLIMFLPVVIWNYQHDWVTIRHLSGLTKSKRAFSWDRSFNYILEYIGGIILINSPFLVLLFSGRKYKATYFHHDNQERKYSFAVLVAPMIGSIVIFFIISIFKRTEVNWPAMSYIALPFILAYGIDKTLAYRKALTATILTLCVLLLLLFPSTADRAGLSYLIPIKIDSMKRMAGWRELSQKLKDLQHNHPEVKPMLTDSYHVASELSFYSQHPQIYCLNTGRRMNQFDIWGDVYQLAPGPLNTFFVTESQATISSLQYDNIDAHYSIPIYYRGECIKIFQVYLIRNLRMKPPIRFTAY